MNRGPVRRFKATDHRIVEVITRTLEGPTAHTTQ
jgi:hypothetical protein